MNEILDKIIRLIPIIHENGSVLIDSNYVICRCTIGHIHKYTHENAIIGLCTTCNSGTNRSTIHRKNAEKIFNVPFIINTTVLDPVYHNAKLKILLKCGELLPDNISDYKIIDLVNCDSKTSIKIFKSINYKPKWVKNSLRDLNDNLTIEKLTR